MTRKSTHNTGAAASQWQWKFGAPRYVEWAWEMQSDPVSGVGAVGSLQPLLTKRVSEMFYFPVL